MHSLLVQLRIAAAAAVLVLAGLTPTKAGGGAEEDLIFSYPVVPIEGSAEALDASDFNRDGRIDLAVGSNSFNASVTLLLSLGDGTFAPGPSRYAGASVRFLSAADFNGDQVPDLAVVSDYSLEVFPGLGNGALGEPVVVSKEKTPMGPIRVGRFNRDGFLDLAVPVPRQGLEKVFLGRGDGTFESGARLPATVSFSAAASGDFNGDGVDDLAVQSPCSCQTLIYLAQGDGSFEEPQPLSLEVPIPDCAMRQRSLVASDFNGDGKIDLALNTSEIHLSFGAGDGTFGNWSTFPSWGFSLQPWIGDLDGDGHKDLAIPNHVWLDVLRGTQEGGFSPPEIVRTGEGVNAVIAEDFDGDGVKDLATAHPRGIHLFKGNGDRTYGSPLIPVDADPRSVAFEGSNLVSGDFNGDGNADFMVAKDEVLFFPGLGDGGFTCPIPVKVGWRPIILVEADFNNDGWPDVAVIEKGLDPCDRPVFCGIHIHSPPVPEPTSRVEVLLGGAGTPSLSAGGVSLGGWHPFAARAGDFNGDGFTDLVVLDHGERHDQIEERRERFSLLLGKGDGHFETASRIPIPMARTLLAGDLNEDGFDDVVSAAGRSHLDLSIHFGGREGFLRGPRTLGEGLNYINYAVLDVLDVNGDGHLDMIGTMQVYGLYMIRSLLWAGKGDGTFDDPIDLQTGESTVLSMVDLDGDGHRDSIAASLAGEIWVRRGAKGGTFGPPVRIASPGMAKYVIAGDFNRDGRVDLLAAVPGGVCVLTQAR